MDPHRKLWNQGQQKLQGALAANDPQKAVELFLDQHAMVHSRKMSKTKLWSFEDEILNDMTDEAIRCIPPGGEHSIAWILFHSARIEDITMNMLVAETPQLFLKEAWAEQLNSPIFHSANKMDNRSVAALSAQIDIGGLFTYRQSVGRRTRTIVKQLKQEEFRQKADQVRLQKVMDEGALLPEAIELLNYWSKRTIAGLLLMPPTRHNFLHLNEAARIKAKLQRAK
jgi:DinB family protein